MSTNHEQNGNRNAIEFQQREQSRQARRHREERIQEAIAQASRALDRDGAQYHRYAAETMRDELLPLLDQHTSRSLAEYDSILGDDPDWDWVAFSSFVDDPDRFVSAFRDGRDGREVLRSIAGTGDDPQLAARLTIEKALSSMVAIAAHEDVVHDEYTAAASAEGFATKVGIHRQQESMDIGDPVGIVSEQSGALKTLFTGGTGQGKSAALETEAEDYYLRNHLEWGRGMKLIDIVGAGDGENWFYDVPQQDDTFTDIRERMGLPPTLADRDDPVPDMEVLAPLTPGLIERELPYDTDDGEFIVRPFTVPASEIRKPLLVSMITAKLTPQQESIIRDAYDEVDRTTDDWALRDLAEEIKRRDELPADKKTPVVRTLRQLQNQGFIRTKRSEYTIDWREIFESTETVTVFSQAFVDGTIAELIAIGYVIHSIAEERAHMPRLPPAALLMRELWKIAPHNRRQEFDARAAQLQEATGHMLVKLFRENRHRGVHILADTQQPGDLLKSVREMFNRYVVFHTNQKTVQDIFEWTSNDKWRAFYSTLTPKPGVASIVGMTEPALDDRPSLRNIEFVGPVEYAGPSHHHFEEGQDFTGWDSRVQYLDHEELRTPAEMGVSWPADVPTRLLIENGETADDGPDPVSSPVAAFVDECTIVGTAEKTKKKKVKTAFNVWSFEHPDRPDETWDFSDASVNSRFGKRVSQAVGDDVNQRAQVDREMAYGGLKLNDKGEEYYRKAMDGYEDAATPISAD